MAGNGNLKERIRKVFPSKQAGVLVELAEHIEETVKARDFNELKEIVRDLAKAQHELAEAQKRSEGRLTRLELAVNELAEAQKHTEERLGRLEIIVERLAEAQERTELEIAKLAKGLNEARKDIGGLSRTMSYAFENEAFRNLPGFLKERYNIEITEKFIREEVLGQEINILARARKNGNEVYIVGESKLRLDERRDEGIEEVFEELEQKVQAVKKEFGDVEVVRLLITHYASKGFLREASKRGIIVVQSFEW